MKKIPDTIEELSTAIARVEDSIQVVTELRDMYLELYLSKIKKGDLFYLRSGSPPFMFTGNTRGCELELKWNSDDGVEVAYMSLWVLDQANHKSLAS